MNTGLELYNKKDFANSAVYLAQSNVLKPNAPAVYLLSKSLHEMAYDGLALKVLTPLTAFEDWEQTVEDYTEQEPELTEEEEAKGVTIAQKTIQEYSKQLQQNIETMEQEEIRIPAVYNVLFDVGNCIPPGGEFIWNDEKAVFDHIVQKKGLEYYAECRYKINDTPILIDVGTLSKTLRKQGLCKEIPAEQEKPKQRIPGQEPPSIKTTPDENAEDALDDTAQAVSDTIPETGATTLKYSGINFACTQKTKTGQKISPETTKIIKENANLEKIQGQTSIVIRTKPKVRTDSAITAQLATEITKPKIIITPDKICVPEQSLTPEAQEMLERPEQETKIKEDVFTAKRVYRVYTLTQDIVIPPFKIKQTETKETTSSASEPTKTEAAPEAKITTKETTSAKPTGMPETELATQKTTKTGMIGLTAAATADITTENIKETAKADMLPAVTRTDTVLNPEKSPIINEITTEITKTKEQVKEEKIKKGKFKEEKNKEEKPILKTDVWDSATGKIIDDSLIENYVVLYVGKELKLEQEEEHELTDEDWEELETAEEVNDEPLCNFTTNGEIGVVCQNQENCEINDEGKIICTNTYTEESCTHGVTGTIYCNGQTNCEQKGTVYDSAKGGYVPVYECTQEMMPGCTFTDEGVECEGFDNCTIQDGQLNCTNELTHEDTIPEGCTSQDENVYSCEGYLPNACKMQDHIMQCDSRKKIPEQCTIKEGKLECTDYDIGDCTFANGELDCHNNMECGFGKERVECWPKQPDYNVYTPEGCIMEDENLLCADGIDELSRFPPTCTLIRGELKCYEEINLPEDCVLTEQGVKCNREGQYCGFDRNGELKCVKPEAQVKQGCEMTSGGLLCEGYEIGECGFKGTQIICENHEPRDIPEGCEIQNNNIYCNGAKLFIPENCEIKDGKVNCDGKDCYYVNNILICEES
ncbi:hypothetical protein B6U93_03950 [Candidatus Woesearchaeota archaeon ex4484_78]|nr:MAG: hypothetical protein B6U93_03950 [Candidatus Woesearchaeota archaeon ex4484_78]